MAASCRRMTRRPADSASAMAVDVARLDRAAGAGGEDAVRFPPPLPHLRASSCLSHAVPVQGCDAEHEDGTARRPRLLGSSSHGPPTTLCNWVICTNSQGGRQRACRRRVRSDHHTWIHESSMRQGAVRVGSACHVARFLPTACPDC